MSFKDSAEPAEPRPFTGLDLSLYFFGKYEAAYRDDKYDLLFDAARFADRQGFAAVWLPERHFHSFGGLSPNPAVLAAALARETERVQLRAGSVVLPLHHPVRVAEEWAVVDNLSRGRIGIAFASGWHPNDFILRPENYGENRRVMFEDLEKVHALWRGDSLEFANGNRQPASVDLFPRPSRTDLPTWLTVVNNPDTYRRAGELGAGVLTNLMGQSLEDLRSNIAVYREGRRSAGLDPEGGAVTVLLHTFLHEDERRARELARGPFCEYLRASFGLFRRMVVSEGWDVDFDRLGEEDLDYLTSRVFDRYVESSALIGTPEGCAEIAEFLGCLGVDEIACFVDFGVEASEVTASWPALARFQEILAERASRSGDDLEIPLTHGQKQLWAFSHLHELGGRVYNDPLCLELRGPLEEDALRGALDRVVERHEALRVTLDTGGETQHIRPAAPSSLEVVDLSGARGDERQAAVGRWFAEQGERAFDLENGPLFRATLLRLEPGQRHLLALCAHHTIIDGWSWGLICRDLAHCYANPEGAPLEAPSMAYADYVRGMERRADSEEMREHEAYWLASLADRPTRLGVPTDRPRPERRSFRGERVSLRVHGVRGALRQRCRERGATLFMGLLTAYSCLIHRLGDQDDLLIGIHVGGRPLEGSEEIVGYGSHLLPVRSRLRPEGAADQPPARTAGDHLRALRGVVLEAFEHQDYPFGRLIDRLRPKDGDLVRATFNLDRAVDLPDTGELSWDVYPQPLFYSRFDLSCNIIEIADDLVLELDFSTDLWDRPKLVRLLEIFGGWLESLAEDFERPIAELPAELAPTLEAEAAAAP
ncbi:MAG: MupA/Atu3671 family FMN-dependent luciferase-like monooxygenase, partial [Acidobacteriota bacterium]